MSKLSERFKKDIDKLELSLQVPEKISLIEALLDKVNTIPYWNEYSFEQQCYMIKCFVNNSDIDNKNTAFEAILPYATGFGAVQKFLDNEKINAIFINDDFSVHIEIDGRVFNSELILSKSMFQYVLNRAKCVDKTCYIIDISDKIMIKKSL